MDHPIEFIRVFRNTSRSQQRIIPMNPDQTHKKGREKSKSKQGAKNNKKQHKQREPSKQRSMNNANGNTHQQSNNSQTANPTAKNNKIAKPVSKYPKIKLEDAQLVNNKKEKCTLIIGDKSMQRAIATRYLNKLGKNRFGLYMLKQTLCSTIEMTVKQIMQIDDYHNLVKSIGLIFGKSYEAEEYAALRYKRVLFLVDPENQKALDQLNALSMFFESLWPSLFFTYGFVKELSLKYDDMDRNIQIYLENADSAVLMIPGRFKRNKKRDTQQHKHAEPKVYFIHPEYKEIELDPDDIIPENLFQDDDFPQSQEEKKEKTPSATGPKKIPLPKATTTTIPTQLQGERITKYRKLAQEREKQKMLIKKIQQSAQGVVSQPNFIPPPFTINHVERKRFQANSFEKMSKQKIREIQSNLEAQQARAQKQRQYEQLPDAQKYISID